MFTSTYSGLSLVAAAFYVAALSAPAYAHCNDPDGAGWQCLMINGTDYTDQGPQSVTYAGPSTLSHWALGTLNCTLIAGADIAVSHGNNSASFEVQSLASSGSTSCGNLSFDNFPLVVDFGYNGDPYPRYTSGTTETSNDVLKIYHTSTGSTPICEGPIAITFSNDGNGGSSISISQVIPGWFGSCTFSATLTNASVEAW